MRVRGASWPRRGASVVLAALAIFGVLIATGAFAAPGDLDTSFNGRGTQTFNFGGADRATRVAIAPDGGIVAIGSTDATGGGDFAVVRALANGTPDPNFGTAGKVSVGTQPGANDIGGGLVALPNGQIVIAGRGNTTEDFVAKRLTATGTVDTTFGTAGTAVVDFGANEDVANVLRQPDGKLVLAGSTSTGPSASDFAIARLNADGSIDTTFNGTGKQTVDFGGIDSAYGAALTPDGKIVVAGEGGPGNDMLIARLNSDGSLDSSFGTGGKATVDFGGHDGALDVAVQPDGKIVLVGRTDTVGSGDFAIARLNTNGTLDTTFSGDGELTAGYGAANELALGVAIQQNGKIVVLGNGDASLDFVLLRLNADGSPDASFGTGGTVAVDFHGGEFDGGVAIQPDGQIVLVGSTNNADDASDIAMARVNGDPTNTGGGGTGAGGGAPPPSGTVSVNVTTQTPSDGHGAILDMHNSIGASTYQVDINNDGHPEYQGSSAYPYVRIQLPTTMQTTIGVTAIGASGTTSHATLPIKILGIGLPARHAVPILVASSSPDMPTAVTPNAPCDQSQIVAGLIDARGCFALVSSLDDLPASVKSTVARYYKSATYPDWIAQLCATPGIDQKTCDVTKSLVAHDLTYISYKPVQLNGLTITPRGGSPVVFYPDQFRVFATNATVSLGPATLKTGVIDFDLTGITLPFIPGIFMPPNLTFTPTILSFNARQAGIPLIGGFPIDAGAELAFALDNGVRETLVTLHVKLPPVFDVFGSGDQPSTAATAIVTNDSPFHLDTLDINVPHASIGGIGFDNLAFHYSAKGDATANCSRDYWHATAKISLGDGPNGEPGAGFNLTPPPSQNGIAFCAGSFKSAGGVLDFGVPIPPPELFPGVLLNSINFAIQLNPTVLRGGATISALDLFKVSGTLLAAFATRSAPYTLTKADAGADLQDIAPRTFYTTTFAVGGALALTVPGIGELDIAHGGLLYAYPDYVALGAHVDVQLGIFVFHGSLGGQATVHNHHFEADLSANICIRGVAIACAGGLGIVSSVGVVACLNIGPLHPGVGLKTNGKYEVWLIDGCKPSHYWVRDISAPKSAREADAPSSLSFDLARGETAKNVSLTGDGGAPKVLVTGPGGETLSLSADGLTRSGALVGLRADEFGATYIGIDHGKPGRYTITPLPGSVPLGQLSTTLPGYDTNFTGSVTGSGGQLVLHYDARKHGGGQQVTFYEDGTNVTHQLGTSTGGRGTLRFTPAPGAAGKRTIVARATVDGVPIADQTLAHFHFAGTRPVGRPGAVRVRRSGATLLISWGAASGAVGYGITVDRSGGMQQQFKVSARHRSLRIRKYPATEGGTVSVSARGGLGDWSPVRRSTAFKATKKPLSMFRSPR